MSGDHRQNHGKRGRRSLTLVLLPLVALGAAGGGWYWRSQSAAHSAASQATQVRSVLHLETFVLNLSGADDHAYLRAGVDLGLRSEPGAKGEPAPPVALIRDTILSVLSTARSEDVLTPQGKQALKAELLRVLRERAPGVGVEEVYFTEFLIQR
jgi:flagellar basal body-associated protein FliL